MTVAEFNFWSTASMTGLRFGLSFWIHALVSNLIWLDSCDDVMH
jgi:hypothetical protein